MKFKIITAILFSVFITSCAQETPKVKHAKKMTSGKNLTNIKIVNAQDPVCQMKTADFLKDTAVYNNKTYGFCSSSCKDEFKAHPEKYVRK